MRYLLRSPALAAVGAACCAAAAAPCASNYIALSKVEALLLESGCGMPLGAAFTLGCSHCWGAAAALLLALSFALSWMAARRGALRVFVRARPA